MTWTPDYDPLTPAATAQKQELERLGYLVTIDRRPGLWRCCLIVEGPRPTVEVRATSTAGPSTAVGNAWAQLERRAAATPDTSHHGTAAWVAREPHR